MHYTQLFRRLREARGLTLETLARQARRHRNTVINVESGRPVKFKTIAELMVKMGYGTNSPETKSMALLWLESVSGIPFSERETEAAARKAIASYRPTPRDAARQLERAILSAGLESGGIGLLAFAARHREVLSILENVRSLAAEFASGDDQASLKAAEDP
jgi:transcriptional regulator with XRE-family HTH domain